MTENTDAKEEMYRISPRGLMFLRTGSDALWRELEAFVDKRARRDNPVAADAVVIPALLFTNGGVCLLAEDVEENPTPQEA